MIKKMTMIMVDNILKAFEQSIDSWGTVKKTIILIFSICFIFVLATITLSKTLDIKFFGNEAIQKIEENAENIKKLSNEVQDIKINQEKSNAKLDLLVELVTSKRY